MTITIHTANTYTIEFSVINSDSKITVTFFNYIHLSFTMKFIMLMTTYNTRKIAIDQALKCIKRRMAACVNIIHESSIYSWKGKIENCKEFLVIFKTTQKNKRDLVSYIQKNHPYDTPEIIEINSASLCSKYSDWLISQTSNCNSKPE